VARRDEHFFPEAVGHHHSGRVRHIDEAADFQVFGKIQAALTFPG